MARHFVYVAVLCLLLASPLAGQETLFISEYVEGSSNNKAIEIYNPTDATVTLTGVYSLRIYPNGSTIANAPIALTGSVAAGDVFVLAHTSAVLTGAPPADQTSSSLTFNGDDAIELVANGTVIDVIGQVGNQPVGGWGVEPTNTIDNTLRRNSDICQGDSNSTDPFDPALEWAGFAVDTFDGLGIHTASCGFEVPLAPTNLLATPTNARVQLQWTAAVGATTHNVKRSTTPGGPYTTIGFNLSGTDVTDDGVMNGTTYYYVVSGVNPGAQEGPDSFEVSAQPSTASRVVISQIFGGSGPADYTHDYIELFNRSTVPMSLRGWSVQYASATSTDTLWQITPLPDFVLQPGRFFLVREAAAIGGEIPLPPHDASGEINMSNTQGKVAVSSGVVRFNTADPRSSGTVVDFLGYGGANAAEGAPSAPTTSTTAALRTPTCSDTDNNSADFIVGTPNPRNSAVITRPCNPGSEGVTPPANLVATAAGSSVLVTWTASPDAVSYDVFRIGPGLTRTLAGSATASNFTDMMVSANASYLYVVQAVDGLGNHSADSNRDIATTVTFSDDPVASGNVIRAVHFEELRTAANAVRVLAGLPQATFTDPALAALPIKKVHLDEVRAAFDEARALLMLSPQPRADETIVANTTTIKAAHVSEIRLGVL